MSVLGWGSPTSAFLLFDRITCPHVDSCTLCRSWWIVGSTPLPCIAGSQRRTSAGAAPPSTRWCAASCKDETFALISHTLEVQSHGVQGFRCHVPKPVKVHGMYASMRTTGNANIRRVHAGKGEDPPH